MARQGVPRSTLLRRRPWESYLRRTGPARGDGGFTLVEVMVTVLLITVMMGPLGYVFYTSLTAASTNAGRQDAAALATSIISKLEGSPYAQVGFTSSQLTNAITTNPSYGSSSSGTYTWAPNGAGGDNSASEQLVTVATAASFSAGGAPFKPVMTGVVTDGQRFGVVTHLFWASTKVPACSSNATRSTTVTQAYVRVLIQVTWGNGQSVEQDSNIYPGALTPYQGPQYSAASVPPAPEPVAAAPGSPAQTGALTVSWPAPNGWSSEDGECFSVGWADTNQEVFSTGLLSNNVLGGSSNLSYTVQNLAPGGTYTFFVTAYSANGVESTESSDSPAAVAPAGPIITSISPGFGTYLGGTSVTLTGTAFAPSMQVQFVPVGQSPGANWTSFTCSSSTTCTVTSPGGSGLVSVVAETPTGTLGAEVTSPPVAADTFSYLPAIAGVACPGGGSTCTTGSTVTVTGTNLWPGTSFTFGTSPGSLTGIGTSCNAAGTSCTMKVPLGIGTVDIIASNPGGTSVPANQDLFTYG